MLILKKRKKNKHVEKESTFVGTLQRSSPLAFMVGNGGEVSCAVREQGKADGRWLWSGRTEPVRISSDGTACYSGRC